MDSPSDIEALRAALAAERGRAAQIEAELALARAQLADDAATITRQNLEIAKLKRQIYGPRSERTVRLLDQMELVLEELEADATEDEIAAERAATRTTSVAPFTRKRPSRQPFPEHLPRERVVIPAPTTCDCCGGAYAPAIGAGEEPRLPSERNTAQASLGGIVRKTGAAVVEEAREGRPALEHVIHGLGEIAAA